MDETHGINNRHAMRLGDYDWDNWRPVDPATLVFIFEGDRVLLIHKKTGLGKGKVNGPGGKIDPGETPEQCAVRECQEELRITPLDIEYCGQHQFQFTDGYSTQVWVYRSFGYSGTPVETEEAVPLWYALDEIPFDRMWEDDRYWLPLVISGQTFFARWVFDGDRMLDKDLRLVNPNSAPVGLGP